MTKIMRFGYNGTQYKLEGVYLSAGLGMPWDHPVPALDKRQKMDGWMDSHSLASIQRIHC